MKTEEKKTGLSCKVKHWIAGNIFIAPVHSAFWFFTFGRLFRTFGSALMM